MPAAEPGCVDVSLPDPLGRMWFEDDGTLVTERLDARTRYPTSTGSGTGIMTRTYHGVDTDAEPLPVLVVDLSDIAKPGAPRTLIVAFGNVYLPKRTCR